MDIFMREKPVDINWPAVRAYRRLVRELHQWVADDGPALSEWSLTEWDAENEEEELAHYLRVVAYTFFPHMTDQYPTNALYYMVEAAEEYEHRMALYAVGAA